MGSFFIQLHLKRTADRFAVINIYTAILININTQIPVLRLPLQIPNLTSSRPLFCNNRLQNGQHLCFCIVWFLPFLSPHFSFFFFRLTKIRWGFPPTITKSGLFYPLFSPTFIIITLYYYTTSFLCLQGFFQKIPSQCSGIVQEISFSPNTCSAPEIFHCHS